jgi:membrane protein
MLSAMHLWRLSLLAERSMRGFFDAGGTRLAAAISYYALLSLVPLVLVLISVADLLFGSAGTRDRIIDEVVDPLPLTAEGTEELRELLLSATAATGTVGLVGLVGLLWAAGGMMGAIRVGVTRATGASRAYGFVVAKLIDLSMVFLTGGLLIVSAALTVVVRVADEELLSPLGIPGVETLIGMVVPIFLAFITLVMLLRWMPAAPVPWCGAWRGALFGSVALWTVGTGFAFYVDNFARYDTIYGSLGAIVVFLVFVYLAAIILLVAATVAGTWPPLAAAEGPPPENPYAPSRAHQLRNVLRSLVRSRPR